MPAVAVFDTNVLLSGTSWKGKPFECLELARAGAVQGLTCQEILDEFVEKLERKLNWPAEKIAETLADLLSFLQLVKITGNLKVMRPIRTTTKSSSARLLDWPPTLSPATGDTCSLSVRFRTLPSLPLRTSWRMSLALSCEPHRTGRIRSDFQKIDG